MEQYFKWCIKRGGKLSTRLEKMGNRKKVRGKITVALIGMAVLMFGNCLTAAGNGGEISIIRKEYINERMGNDIQVCYPQIQGLDDEEKEKRINYQIRKDATKLIGGEAYEKNRLACGLDYEIKFFNGELISVHYKGWCGGITRGRGIPPVILATNIDIESGKLLKLNDIITNFDTLAELLVEDKFEGITKWEGVAGTFSQGYGDTKEGMEEWLKGGKGLGWYTDGSKFVIMITTKYWSYDEFAIDLSEVEDILDREFLEKLGR